MEEDDCARVSRRRGDRKSGGPRSQPCVASVSCKVGGSRECVHVCLRVCEYVGVNERMREQV